LIEGMFEVSLLDLSGTFGRPAFGALDVALARRPPKRVGL